MSGTTQSRLSDKKRRYYRELTVVGYAIVAGGALIVFISWVLTPGLSFPGDYHLAVGGLAVLLQILEEYGYG